jgi:predicted cupin superfamily sugar epimerase
LKIQTAPVLPDGIFSSQKSQYGENFGRSCSRNCCYFMTILYILRQNGIFYVHLVRFAIIWYILPNRKTELGLCTKELGGKCETKEFGWKITAYKTIIIFSTFE